MTMAGLLAVAGGWMFISFPALVWLGVPPVMADATATLTAVADCLRSAWAFRFDIRAEGSLRQTLPLTVIGAVAGVSLLMVTPDTG